MPKDGNPSPLNGTTSVMIIYLTKRIGVRDDAPEAAIIPQTETVAASEKETAYDIYSWDKVRRWNDTFCRYNRKRRCGQALSAKAP